MVSLDAIRAEKGVSTWANQGQVIQAAYEQARVHLRAGQDFVWNGTNVTRQNRGRAWVVPEAMIVGLERKLEPPRLAVAHEMTVVMG